MNKCCFDSAIRAVVCKEETLAEILSKLLMNYFKVLLRMSLFTCKSVGTNCVTMGDEGFGVIMIRAKTYSHGLSWFRIQPCALLHTWSKAGSLER